MSPLEMQQKLQEYQKRGLSGELTKEEIREAIGLIRSLRRTNTGPAASADEKKAKKARGKPSLLTNEELMKSILGD